MKRFNKTATLKDLLEESVFNSSISKNKMNNVIKHSTIFSFWNSVVGLKFSNHTKPYAIKANKLYVSTKSPVVAQELSLYKLKLLNKINSYSKPLGIEINDIIFNYKNYTSSVPETLNQKEDIPVELKEKEIDNVNLDEKVIEQFKQKVEKMHFLNEAQKENLLSKILKTKKAHTIQKKED